jgi:hypothetical protein
VTAPCRCGCRQQVTRPTALYRPGHDARHAAAVGRALIAAGHADPALLDALPSLALRGKAEAMLSRRQVPGRPPVPSPVGGSTSTADEADVVPLVEVPAGDSQVQRDAEAVLLAALSASIGVPLAPARVHLPDGTHVECDGVSADPPVLVEAWAHQGPPKSAQRNKVLADALKLVHVAAALGGRHRKILCFSDDEAVRPFLSRRSWYAGALRTLDVQVHVVDLPSEWRERILEAQKRQYR